MQNSSLKDTYFNPKGLFLQIIMDLQKCILSDCNLYWKDDCTCSIFNLADLNCLYIFCFYLYAR